MPDVFTQAKRSAALGLIRGKGNKDTELRIIALFREHGITGWRRGQKVFEKPDFVFRRERVAVFVGGCFWHGCPKPKHAPMPKNRAEWWAAKLGRNRERDRLVTKTLRKAGWRVVRVWECDLARKHWPRVARRIELALQPGRLSPPPPRRALELGGAEWSAGGAHRAGGSQR
jgi:DNA mismatch endonuclease (patch repair protein)